MAEIRLLDIFKSYGEKEVLKGIDITINEGELISLLGPSGCGKTTLLKIIAGLEEPEMGRILFNSRDVTELEANKRNSIIVFQDYRLFPHMTVFENIEFGLKVRNMDKKLRIKLVNEMLELTQLVGQERSYPSQVSGGQKQRAALARALVVKPGVLLLDEPFSNLDTTLRESMREFVLKLHKELKFTAVLVTHDKEEAFMMSDRVAVLINGELQQFDKPVNIYKRPETKALADFIGESNYIKGTVKNGVFESCLGRVDVGGPDKSDAQLMIRYDQIKLTKDETGIACEIIDKRFGGREIYYKVKVDDSIILTLLSESNDFNVSDKSFILLNEYDYIAY